MLTNEKIKLIKSLSEKKHRKEQGLFVVEGDKMVRELADGPFIIEEVFALKEWLSENAAAFGKKHRLTCVNASQLGRMSHFTTPNKALALLRMPDNTQLPAQDFQSKMLAIDSVQDPGNMGTIIRTADWFGVKTIICSPSCADVFNPKVLQATMGSFQRVKVYYMELDEYFQSLRPETIVMAATLDGENMYKTGFPENGVLLMGNESKGVSANLMKFVNKRIFIPSPITAGQPRAESLNVGIATGIILSEWCKQG